MSMEQLCKEYVQAKYEKDTRKRIAVLTRCAEQTEDADLANAAKRDLGMIYLQGDDSVKDEEKAARYLKEAADAGDELGKQFYGLLLYQHGEFEAFRYLREALELGNIYSAYVLHDNLHMQDESAMARMMISVVETQIAELVDSCREKIKAGQDADGAPQCALALVGLYDLGEKVGIDRNKGREYLDQAAKKGYHIALFMKENPVLMKPETMNQYQLPTEEELKKMDDQLLDAHLNARRKPRKKRRWPLILALIVVVAAVVYFCRKIIISAAISIFEAVAPILAIVFLLGICYIAYGDEGGSASGSGSSGPDPMQEYQNNRDCRRMPSCIYDSQSNRWDKVRAGADYAIYRNSDIGEDTINSCDITSKYAYSYERQYHWY